MEDALVEVVPYMGVAWGQGDHGTNRSLRDGSWLMTLPQPPAIISIIILCGNRTIDEAIDMQIKLMCQC